MRKAKGGGASGNTPMSDSDKSAQQLRALQMSEASNKTCLDCGQRGPTYVNMTIGSFVCTKCSGMLRGINPPHRIKSISMSSFSADEIDFLRSRGNLWCQLVWLGLYEGHKSPNGMDEERVKEFIIEKYEKKRYYVDPSTIATSLPQPNQSNLGGWTSNESSSGRSNLIGSTLTGRLASGTGNAQTSRPNSNPSSTSSVVSRPTNSQPQPSENSLQSKPDSSFLADFSAFTSGPAPNPTPLVMTSNANPGVDPFGTLSKSQPNTGTPNNFNANAETNDFFADFDGAQFDPPVMDDTFWTNSASSSTPLLSTYHSQRTNTTNISSYPKTMACQKLAPKLKPPPGFIPPVFNHNNIRPNLNNPVKLTPTDNFKGDLNGLIFEPISANLVPSVVHPNNFAVSSSHKPQNNPFLPISEPICVAQSSPPKLPPRPIISRKVMLPVSSNHDYSNLQRYKVRFEPDQTLVEKVEPAQRQLAPKRSNPSLPNISVLATLREEIDESDDQGSSVYPPKQASNPFSPYYTPKVSAPLVLEGTNPFRKPKNPLQLGEDFFASLFDTPLKLGATNASSKSATLVQSTPKREPNPIVSTNKTNLVFTATPIPKSQASTNNNTPGSLSASAFGGPPTWGATPPSKPLMQPKQQMVKQQATRPQSTPITSNQNAADKYAALKDLDEIFKSTVALTDSPSETTGVSIFGSSPIPASNLSKSFFEKESSAKGSIFDSTSKDSWATSFNKPENSTSPNAGTTWDWADRNGTKPRANSAAGTTGATSPPVNPFTGAGNMAQLNTSPWPTTGTSPVNNPPSSTTSNWPAESTSSNPGSSAVAGFDSDPFATFNLQSGTKGNTMDFFGTGSQPLDDPFATNKATSAQGNGNFDAFFQTITAPGNGAMGNGNPWTSPNAVQNDLFTVNNPGIPNSSKKSTNPFL